MKQEIEKMNFQISHAGRPRKAYVHRDRTTGRSRGESVESVKAVAWAYRSREVGEVHKDDPLAESILGRLKLIGGHSGDVTLGISLAQYNTGVDFGKLVRRYAKIMNIPLGSPKSPTFDMVSGGISIFPEPDEKTIFDTKRDYADATSMLCETDRTMGTGNKIQKITKDVCMDLICWGDFQVDENNIGFLKYGLNTLARMKR